MQRTGTGRQAREEIMRILDEFEIITNRRGI